MHDAWLVATSLPSPLFHPSYSSLICLPSSVNSTNIYWISSTWKTLLQLRGHNNEQNLKAYILLLFTQQYINLALQEEPEQITAHTGQQHGWSGRQILWFPDSFEMPQWLHTWDAHSHERWLCVGVDHCTEAMNMETNHQDLQYGNKSPVCNKCSKRSEISSRILGKVGWDQNDQREQAKQRYQRRELQWEQHVQRPRGTEWIWKV